MNQSKLVLGGRYELTGQAIAHGGMGSVYPATDCVLNREVAVKILSEAASADEGARRRFTREAHSAARISHPNAVAVFDAGEQDGRPFIVMERLSGKTLAEAIAEGPMSPPHVRRIAREVLSVLGHAHSLGIVHRDIKPRNVLIDDAGSARVSDFGIAKLLEDDATRTRDLLGTPSYIAPELFSGVDPSFQSDIFAVGVLMYELLTGVRPCGTDTPFAVVDRMRRSQYPPLREVAPNTDQDLCTVVERALDPNPKNRFASAAEMIAALGGDTGPSVFAHRGDALGEATRKLSMEQDVATVSLAQPAEDLRSGRSSHADRPQGPSTFAVWKRRLSSTPAGLALAAGMLIAAMLIFASGSTRLAAPAAPRAPRSSHAPVTAPGTSVPAPPASTGSVMPLDQALRELDRAVSP
ncbi:MAG: serine/threonine-protein kinase [Actinomycetota bacterium]